MIKGTIQRLATSVKNNVQIMIFVQNVLQIIYTKTKTKKNKTIHTNVGQRCVLVRNMMKFRFHDFHCC